MSRFTAIQSAASATRGQRAMLLIVGLIFAMALTACEAALASDNVASSQNDRTDAGAESQAAPSRQVSDEKSLAATDFDPDQLYEWTGLIEWVDLEGGHFIINRGCDRWSLAVETEDLYAKLKELHEGRAVVWGHVADGSIYGRRTINVTSVFGPDDPRPAIALPTVPCPDTPAPTDLVVLNPNEITLHGELIWRGGRVWLNTDRGRVALKFPDYSLVPPIPDQAAPDPDNETSTNDSLSLGVYGVAGLWSLADSSLVIEVRDIQEWPFRNVAYDSCGDGRHVFDVEDSKLAVNGWLYRGDGEWLLRTRAGIIHVHPGFNSDDLLSATEASDADLVAPDVASSFHQVVVIGPWKTDGTELHMEAERFVRIKTVCDNPQPPRPPILPGEIAALGALVFEDGRPFLQTPQGRIILLTVTDDNPEPQPVPGDALMDLVPTITEADIEPASPGDEVVRPLRYVLVVGKWQVSASGQLAIVVRYAIPWPYPYADVIEPMPVPGFAIPAPMPVDPTGIVIETAVSGGPAVKVTPISVDAVRIDGIAVNSAGRADVANTK